MSGRELVTTEATHNREAMMAVIDNAPNLADSTKAQYKKALANYLDTGGAITDAAELASYAQGLSKSSRAFLKASVRRVTERMATAIKGQVTPETVNQAQAALMRIEAMQDAIQTEQSKGTKAHTWLSQKQVHALYQACGNGSDMALRDRVVIGLMVAAGLRRLEAVNLKWQDVKLQPVGDRMRCVLEVHGKGAKDRVVPISDRFAAVLDEWRARSKGQDDDFVCRSLGMDRKLGDSLSPIGLFKIVRKHGAAIGKPKLAPHDLRRTYAQLAYDAGVPITQISVLLGHASIATTQRYLNLELDLDTTASDFIPWG